MTRLGIKSVWRAGAFAVYGLFAGGYAATAVSATNEPLAVVNHSPLVANRAIPRQRTARVRDGLSVGLGTEVTSHFIEERRGGESVFLDGETQTLTLDFRYGFGDRWDLGLLLRHRRHAAGFLDGVINDWHDFFAMPDGGRSQFPTEVLAYRYTGEVESYQRTSPASGVVDPVLEASYSLVAQPDLAIAAVLGAQLQHGTPEALTGAGGLQHFAAIRFSGDHRGDWPLTWHGQVGYSYAPDSAPLPSLAQEGLWFAGLGADWQLTPDWSLLAQFDAHEAPFNSALNALGSNAGLLSLGLRFQAAPGWQLEIGFSEDILVETAPDITFFGRLLYFPAD